MTEDPDDPVTPLDPDDAPEVPLIELAIISRPGGRPYNEDACGHWHSEQHLCCVVADGAGGHGGGEVASRIAVQHIIERYSAAPVGTGEEVNELIVSANHSVIAHRADAPELRHMHTTVVSLFIELDTGLAVWGHAGDSRLYVFRDGQMLAHTRDHSLVQSLVEAGLLTPEQMRTHPRRSELQSALGTEPAHLRVTTATRPWLVQRGDVFLLCTDGLWEFVDETEMCSTLSRSSDPSSWLDKLEAAVLRNAEAAGKPGHDNFSGIAVWAMNSA